MYILLNIITISFISEILMFVYIEEFFLNFKVPFRNYANKKYKQKLRKIEVPVCRTLKSTEDSVASKGLVIS